MAKEKNYGTFFYGGVVENVDFAKNDIRELIERCPVLDVKEPFHEYYERSKKNKDTKMIINKRANIIKIDENLSK